MRTKHDERAKRLMISEQDTRAFIRAAFRSVWSLELLCYLSSRRHEAMSRGQLIEALRASEAVMQQSLAGLSAAGLILDEPGGRVRFAPATAELEQLASAAQALYAKAPNAVRRLIVTAANPGITAFADAFKLREDK